MGATDEFFDAVKAGDAAKVERMLARDRTLADAKGARGLSAVTVAAYHGQEDVLAAILRHGPSMTVHDAALAGDVRRVRELADRDPSLANAPAPDGFPPLGLAAHKGRTEVVRYLLSRGADVNFAAPGIGFTALTGAVAAGHTDVVRLLIEAGADVNHRYQAQRFSPLITAAVAAGAEVVSILIEAGADVNARTTDGKTALSMAMEKGRVEIAELLEAHGAVA
jgi:ankyrin repeat protein